MSKENPPEKIRVSIGSAAILGLTHCRLDAEPTTIYLMTYSQKRCVANCAFCPQARMSKSRADMLSRISWPVFRTGDVINEIEKAFIGGRIKRVCIQALNYPTVFEDLLRFVKSVRSVSDVAISVSCQPLGRKEMIELAKAGVNRVSIALDVPTRELFEKIKGSLNRGPYSWEKHLRALRNAVAIFGKGSVTTHLIMGIGESEESLVRMIQWCSDNGVYPALFAFTPIPGTAMEAYPSPPIGVYRRVQMAQYLITHGIAKYSDMTFKEGKLVTFGDLKEDVHRAIESGEPFRTSGCPDCNRPFYNERPGGTIYNYPRKPSLEEIGEIKKEIGAIS